MRNEEQLSMSRWLEEDKRCPTCSQVTERCKGLTKQNVKRLFSFNFNLNEIIITFMIIMVLVLAYAYKNETQQCRDWIKPLHDGTVDECKNVCDMKCRMIRAVDYTNFNASELLNISNISNGFNGITP